MAMEPRFNARVGADISDFQKKIKEVDRTIRKLATGVVVDINANIRNLQQKAAQASSLISNIANADPTVSVNANLNDFTNRINEAQQQTSKLSRKITEARIGADIGSFESRLVEVTRALADADDTVTPRIEADIRGFSREIIEVQDRMREIARSTASPEVEADIGGFMAQMAAVQAQLTGLTERHDIDINANTSGAMARIRTMLGTVRAMTAKDIVVTIKSRWKNYQNVMGAMASFSRNIGEVMAMTSRGITIAMSPAIVPILSSVVGLVGQLGPMIGTVGGSAFALATSFGAAGLGAAGFAAVAIPSIKSVIEASGELKDIDEKLAKATTWKQRNKLLKEQKLIYAGMSKEQAAAGEALNKFQSGYSQLVKDMEKPVLNVFASALTAVSTVLQMARPMIESSTKAVQNLMKSFNQNLKTDDVKGFFDFMTKYAGPALETVGKAIGNFTMGLFNMMGAFGPLSVETQNGFLGMSESFRKWSASLGENKKFQSFVSYVSTNMPKIRSIFGDAIKGVVNVFAAFAPSSADMMTGLQNMMSRFREFSATLSENKGFQNFITYVKENGPQTISLIGNIIKTIVEIGKALAPAGAALLEIGNKMLNFASGLLKAHPWIGKVGAAALIMGGAFMAALPNLVAINALTGGLITTIIKLGATFAKTAIRMAASMVTAMGPIGWIVIGVTALAILIYKNWDQISAWTKKAWTAVSTAISTAVSLIMGYVQEKFPALYTIIQSYMTMAKTVISTIWNFIKGTFTNVLSFLKSLVHGDFQGMKDAISNQMELVKSTLIRIWGAVKEYMTTLLGVLKAKAIEKFSEMAAQVVGKVLLLKNQAMAKWLELKAKTLLAISELKGKLISYFAELATKVVSKVLQLKNQAIAKWVELKTKALSTISELKNKASEYFGQLKDKIKEKMTQAVSAVKEKVSEMPGKIRESIDDMVSAGADLVGGVISGIKSKISEGLGVIGGLATDLIARFRKDTDTHSPSRAFADIAKWFAPGIAKGVGQTGHLAVDAVSGMATNLIDRAKSDLGVHSPSRVMMTIGKFVGEGLAKGITGTAKQVQDAASKLTNLLKDGISSNASTIAKNNKSIASTSQAIREQSNRVNDLVKQRAKLAKKKASTFSIDNQIKNARSTVNKSNQKLKDLRNENANLKGEQTAFKAVQNFAKTQMTKLNVIARQRDQVAVKLKAARDKLADAIKLRDDFAKSVQDNAMSFGSITSTDATSGVDIAAQMKERLQAITDFQANVKKLEKAGLNGATLQDIVNAGVEGGGAKAAALVGSSTSVIKDINKTQSDINARAKNLGKDTAKQFYGVGVNSAQGMVKGLESQAKALETSAKTISDALVKAVKKRLDIHSPSRVFGDLGANSSEGVETGVCSKVRPVFIMLKDKATEIFEDFKPALLLPGSLKQKG